MSELIDRQALLDEIWKMRMNYQMMDDTHTADKIMHGLYRAEQAVKEAPTIPAPRWHRVEEPPKKTAKYLVWVDVNNGVFAAYPELRTAAYNVVYERWYVDGDQRTEWIGTPRYWMPIEPPKEDA